MAFPESLTLVTVTVRADLLPDGGSTGWVRLRYDRQPLTSADADSIVAYVDETEVFGADGTCTVQVPATNAVGWTPQDFAYDVTLCSGSRVRRGTAQLDRASASVDLADVIQWEGAAEAGVTYATVAQLAAHTGDTTDVHGIPDTDDLVYDDDARLTNARTPTAHAASHADGGSDELALDGGQITTGTVPAARLPVGTAEGTVAAGDDARITGALQTTGGTITGDLVVADDDPAERAYRFKTSGSALDLDAAASDLFVSAYANADFSGTQRNYLRLESGAQLAHALGRWLFADGAFAGAGVADLDPSTGLAGLGSANSLTNIPFAGRRTAAGPPTTGTWTAGAIVQAADGFWQCTVAGTPGSWLLVAAAEGASRIVDAGEYVIPRRDIITESPATSGNLYVTHFTAARSETIQTIRTGIGGTVATSAEHAWLGIMSWDGTDYTPVAASVDDPTRWTASFQTYDTQLYAWDHPGEEGFEGWNKVAGQQYAFWILWIGEGTAPSLPAGGGWYADALEEPRTNAYIGSQTQPPAAPISGSFFGPDSRRFQGLMER